MRDLEAIVSELRDNSGRMLAAFVPLGSSRDGFWLLNKTFLVLAGVFDGVPKAFRIPGCVEASDRLFGDRVRFGPDAVRIQNGSREGVVVPLYQVNEYEDSSTEGVKKILIQGENSARISQNRRGDVKLVELLDGLMDNAEDSLSITPPDIYIAARKEACLRKRVGGFGNEGEGELPDGRILRSFDLWYGKGVTLVRSGSGPFWVEQSESVFLETPGAYVSIMNYAYDFMRRA